MDANNYLNLETVKENFEKSKLEGDDIHMGCYLKSFEELNKFFTLLGSLFSFVSSELGDKLGILKAFQNSEDSHHFETVKSMIQHEKDSKLLEKSNYVSGSRTLLRLHRALEFIQEFLGNVHQLNGEESTSHPCIEAYNRTLGNHHSFFIRSGAKLAMYTLPNKNELLHRVCGSEEDIRKAQEILPDTLAVSSEVHELIHKLYDEHNLHSLP